MNNKVTAIIDVSTPTGRRIVRDLEKHKRTVSLDYPKPEGKTYTVEEAFEMVEKKLNDHYGTNYKI